MTCGRDGSTGCTDWALPVPCQPGETCTNGRCQTWKERLFPKPWPATASLTGTLDQSKFSCDVTWASGQCIFGSCQSTQSTGSYTVSLFIDAAGTVSAQVMPLDPCVGLSPGLPPTTQVSEGGFTLSSYVSPFIHCVNNPLSTWGELQASAGTLYFYIMTGVNARGESPWGHYGQ